MNKINLYSYMRIFLYIEEILFKIYNILIIEKK